MAHGGKRPGAGRKPGSLSRSTGAKLAEVVKDMYLAGTAGQAVTASMILGSVNEMGLWKQHLLSEDPNISLRALTYLTDRRDGKAIERVVSADVTKWFEGRTEDEVEFFAEHGCWPNEVSESKGSLQ